MKKKVLCMFLVAVTVTALFCINASAALTNSRTWIEEDFTRPEGQQFDELWVPSGWKLAGRTAAGGTDNQNQGIYRVTEDGYVELAQGNYIGFASFQYIPPTLPDNFVFMFDVKFPTVGANYNTSAMVMCSINSYCQGVYANGQVPYVSASGGSTSANAGAHNQELWYTYVYCVRGDKMSVYRKAENETSFTTILENVTMAKRSGHEIWGTISMGDARMLIDNVKIFSGKSLVGSEIEISEDKTKITGTLTIRNGDATPGNSDTALAVMMAYDKKGKILGMKYIHDAPVFFGDADTVPVEMDCSGFYDKLNGGTVELYLWDTMGSFKPLTEAYVFSVQQ